MRQVWFSTIGVWVAKKQTAESPVRVGKTAANGTSSNWSERAPRPANGQRPERRYFSNDFKLSILAAYDRCSEPGEKGALLRREGLYSSIITDWRRQHREGVLKVTEGRGSEGGRGAPTASEVARLRAENERLKVKLAKAEAIIEVQGKVQALLEELSKSADTDDT
jgi:transposase-like protein